MTTAIGGTHTTSFFSGFVHFVGGLGVGVGVFFVGNQFLVLAMATGNHVFVRFGFALVVAALALGAVLMARASATAATGVAVSLAACMVFGAMLAGPTWRTLAAFAPPEAVFAAGALSPLSVGLLGIAVGLLIRRRDASHKQR
ncbi:hypothetical protein [Zhihengliuella halotolerans]|uniref:Uncharacterized protein n=1 Tax=Zhihengliuella halotolerans TaxID=370736 RepID=A0A4Q8AGI6_9MICC|nr:hypothetical protein [Zhihengliuella halotolerans]RZU63497.1 hypothetical protein EV380_3118 [Zhihengliuella halotolerans]